MLLGTSVPGLQLSSSEAANAWNDRALLTGLQAELLRQQPDASVAPKSIQYRELAYSELASFTDADESIPWSTSMQDVDGQRIVRGTSRGVDPLGAATSANAR